MEDRLSLNMRIIYKFLTLILNCFFPRNSLLYSISCLRSNLTICELSQSNAKSSAVRNSSNKRLVLFWNIKLFKEILEQTNQYL